MTQPKVIVTQAQGSADGGHPAGAPWCDGWWLGAERLPSPNFGARPSGCVIDLLVLHAISLPPGCYGGPEVLQFFTNQLDWRAHPYFAQIEGMAVSAHFFVRRDGVVWQLVSCDDRAWHAGASCYRGRSNCNDDSIGIELEGLDGQAFDDAQYAALQTLCAAVLQHYPAMAHIAGHEHIAPGRKTDPGSGFDWPRLQESLNLPPPFFPADVLNNQRTSIQGGEAGTRFLQAQK